jgi:hypothetical protein
MRQSVIARYIRCVDERKMRNRIAALIIGGLASVFSVSLGKADIVYNNPANGIGTCEFSCEGGFQAQEFTLTGMTTIRSATFGGLYAPGAVVDQSATVNWMFLSVNADPPNTSFNAGLPDILIASGSSLLLTSVDLGKNFGDYFHLIQQGFDLTPVTLGAGSYYFALQYRSYALNTPYVYLASGQDSRGGAFTPYLGDPGRPWGRDGGVAISLSDTVTAVPEPSTWATLLIGFAGIGFEICRQSRRVSLA